MKRITNKDLEDILYTLNLNRNKNSIEYTLIHSNGSVALHRIDLNTKEKTSIFKLGTKKEIFICMRMYLRLLITGRIA